MKGWEWEKESGTELDYQWVTSDHRPYGWGEFVAAWALLGGLGAVGLVIAVAGCYQLWQLATGNGC